MKRFFLIILKLILLLAIIYAIVFYVQYKKWKILEI